MKYRLLELGTYKHLTQMVYDIYEITTSEAGVQYSTAPNGIIGISIITKGNSKVLVGDTWEDFPDFSIYGLVKKPDLISISPDFREIAIGFKPYFLQLLLNESMSEIVNCKNLDANHVFKKDNILPLKEKIIEATTDDQILDAVEQFIAKQMTFSKVNERLFTAMNLVYHEGITNVQDIGDKINLSTTSVRNLFRDGIGRSPKEVISILRTNKILKSAQSEYSSLTEMCYKFGYFDQAHFIHEFSNIMGMSPSRYFNNKNLAFDFYNSGRWQGNIFDL